MTEAFNPYREWLGLDTDARCLNHYQLLDLPEFEADAARIHSAADRALARVRSHRPGPQAAAWARLLDTLSAAKACLTDPARKSVYDESLRQGEERRAERAAPEKNLPVSPGIPAPSEKAAVQKGDSILPEVALVNQIPDLFPPGMAPSARPTPAAAKPAVSPVRPPSPDVHGGPSSSQASSPSDSPAAASRQPVRKPKRTPPPLPPATLSTVAGAGQQVESAATFEPSVGDVSTPVPPAPMNAHVAPPRRPKQSLLPLVVSIAAVLIVVTLIVMLLAMRGDSDSSSAVTPPPTQPSPAHNLAGTSNANPSLLPPAGWQGSKPADKITRQTNDSNLQIAAKTTLPSTTSHPPPSSGGEQQSAANASSPTVAAQSPAEGSQEPLVPTTDPTTIPAQMTQADTTQPAAEPAAAPDPAPPNRAELVKLEQTLTSARQALGDHQFAKARKDLATAGSLAVLPQHKAMVQRMQRLTDCTERFWEVVENVVAAFNGAEELSVGSGDLIVIVVETGPGSITIRNQGKNTRYTLVDMPPGLALAIARQQLGGDDPDDLVLLGACLAAVTDRKPIYLEEARKYWTLAQMAGTEVDDLLLTLTDSYDLAP